PSAQCRATPLSSLSLHDALPIYFHKRRVRVLFPMMMWDQGTRDPGRPWPEAIASLMAEIGADGVNGDTQDGVPLVFSLAADKVRSAEHASELQSPDHLVCRLLLE